MRVAFAGTPEFARAALAALHAAGFEIVLVLTQPDRPAGRGMKLAPSPVKAFALEHGLALAQPRSLRLDGSFPDDARSAREALLAARPDVMVVAAYGLILPPWVLALPRLGCLNIHASLLPRWRGAAPIQRAIEAGDARTGITIMQMDAGLDTGDMLLVETVAIAPDDSAATLQDRLAAIGPASSSRRCGSPPRAPSAHAAAERRRDLRPQDRRRPRRPSTGRRRPRPSSAGCARSTRFPARRAGSAARRSSCGAARWSTAAERPGEILPCRRRRRRRRLRREALQITELQRAGGRRVQAGAVPRRPTRWRRACAFSARVELCAPRRHLRALRRAASISRRKEPHVQSDEDGRADGGHHGAVHGDRLAAGRAQRHDDGAHRRARHELLQLLVFRQAGAEDVQRARGRRDLGAAVLRAWSPTWRGAPSCRCRAST